MFYASSPPCGTLVIVAHDHVVNLLRLRWLKFREQESVPGICRQVQAQVEQHWQDSQRKAAENWLMHEILSYQRKWAAFFVRASQKMEPMTEAEIEDAAAKHCPVPYELELKVEDPLLLRRWEMWHRVKFQRPVRPSADNLKDGGQDIVDEPTVIVTTWGDAIERNI